MILGVNLRESAQLELAGRIAKAGPLASSRWNESSAYDMFGRIDATVRQGVLMVLQPQRVVEVGSGFSTAVILDTADSAGNDALDHVRGTLPPAVEVPPASG